MARPFIPGAAVLAAGVGAAFLAKRLAAKRGGGDFGQMIERMPEGSPPRWVFDNVAAIRKNTDRILELLEGKPTTGALLSRPSRLHLRRRLRRSRVRDDVPVWHPACGACRSRPRVWVAGRDRDY